jgi:hypothetical protein
LVSDDTDLNNDVCRSLVLTRSGRTVVLQISVVVPVAIVLSRNGDFIDSSDPISLELAAIMRDSGAKPCITLIDRDLVRLDVAFQGEKVTLYRVLFSETDLLA